MSNNFTEVPFPEMHVMPKIKIFENNNDDDVNLLLSFRNVKSFPFSITNKRVLYNICVKLFFIRQLKGRKDTKWRSLFSESGIISPSWRLLYKNPLQGLEICNGEFCTVLCQQECFSLNAIFQILLTVLCVKNLMFFMFFMNVVNYCHFLICLRRFLAGWDLILQIQCLFMVTSTLLKKERFVLFPTF